MLHLLQKNSVTLLQPSHLTESLESSFERVSREFFEGLSEEGSDPSKFLKHTGQW